MEPSNRRDQVAELDNPQSISRRFFSILLQALENVNPWIIWQQVRGAFALPQPPPPTSSYSDSEAVLIDPERDIFAQLV